MDPRRMVQAEHELLRELGEPSALPSARLGGVEVKLARGVIGVLMERRGSEGRKGQERERGRGGRRRRAGRRLTRGRRKPLGREGTGAGGRVHRGARKKRERARGRGAPAASRTSPEACATEKRSLEPAPERFIARRRRRTWKWKCRCSGEREDVSSRRRRNRRRRRRRPSDARCADLALASTRVRGTRGRECACEVDPGRSARGRRIQNRIRTAERSKTSILFVIRQRARDVHG